MMFLFFLARAQHVSCGEITVLTSTKKKVRRVLARKSLPQTNQNSHSAFSHQIRNNSKKDKTKTSQMMGWIENRPTKFLNQNFVRQGLPAKSKSVSFRFISLICAGFFACRSCEYLKVPRREMKCTKQLCIRNIRFFSDGRLLSTPSANLEFAESVAVTFEMQKNEQNHETIIHGRSDDPVLCPVKQWTHLVNRIWSYREHTSQHGLAP